MVSNYDRIYSEIRREADRLVPGGMDAETLVTLIMTIVDFEDQHRTKAIRVNQLVEESIETAARAGAE